MVLHFKKKTDDAAEAGSAAPPPPAIAQASATLPPPVIQSKTGKIGFSQKMSMRLRDAGVLMAGAAVAAAAMGTAGASMGSIMTSAIGVAGLGLGSRFNLQAKKNDRIGFTMPNRAAPQGGLGNLDDAIAEMDNGTRETMIVKGPLRYKTPGTMWVMA